MFDDGNFSEYETVLLTDWMAHTPHDVLAKNFGVTQQALEKMPKREKFIFQAAVPGPLEADLKVDRWRARPVAASILLFAKRSKQSPSVPRAEKCASSIPASSKSPRPLPRRS